MHSLRGAGQLFRSDSWRKQLGERHATFDAQKHRINKSAIDEVLEKRKFALTPGNELSRHIKREDRDLPLLAMSGLFPKAAERVVQRSSYRSELYPESQRHMRARNVAWDLIVETMNAFGGCNDAGSVPVIVAAMSGGGIEEIRHHASKPEAEFDGGGAITQHGLKHSADILERSIACLQKDENRTLPLLHMDTHHRATVIADKKRMTKSDIVEGTRLVEQVGNGQYRKPRRRSSSRDKPGEVAELNL